MESRSGNPLDSFTFEIKEYDLLDRVVVERIEDTIGNVLVKKKYVHDEAGRLTQVIGYPLNKETALMQYEYDGFGRLSKSLNALGQVTQFLYDDAYVNEWGQKGHKRTLIDRSGNQTEEIFDNDDHLIRVTQKDQTGQILSNVETLLIV